MPSPTPVPSPTLEFTEIVFSLDIHESFVNYTDGYNFIEVDSFEADGEVIINLQIRGLDYPSRYASNGFVIDNNETGSNRRSIAFVYQDNEWRIFEHDQRTGGLDLIWTNRSLSPKLECTLHLSADGKTLELILPDGRHHLTLGSSLWQVGERLSIRVQVAPQSRFEIVKLMRLAAPISSSPNQALTPNPNQILDSTATPGLPALRDLAELAGIEIGVLIMPGQYQARGIEKREFNLGIATFSWKDHMPVQGQFDLNWTDVQVSFATENGMGVRLLHLVFPADVPEWLQKGSFSRDELIEILRSSVSSIVENYKGQIHQYVVVNEPYIYPYRVNDIFYKTIGTEYIEIAFQAARDADPTAILIYNDSGNHTSTGITTGLTREIVQRLKTKDLIDGVGLQMHLDGSNPPNKEDVIATMRSYAVPVYVTEFDVNMKNVYGTEEERYAIQAKIYGDMLEACIESGVCKSFSVWGIGDYTSWIEMMPGYQHFSTRGDPTMYDDSWQPKPAYYAILDVLLGLSIDTPDAP
jgi:endo-1,4-beta-xylanase